MSSKKLHVKTGDTVMIMVGDKKTDRGKTGKVLEVSPKEGKVIVEGRNMVKKHLKPKRMGEQGGIIDVESPIYACKVALVCPKCKKPTRAAYTVTTEGDKKIKKRRCVKCGETF